MSSESAPDPQTFLCGLDKKLWTAADQLRSNLDSAVYKHAALGLIFLKYVSDSFAQRQADIEPIHQELEERDYYIEKNVFWVPALRSDEIPVVSRNHVPTGISPLPNLVGFIDLTATIPFPHADLRAHFVMGNPPFNIKEWWDGKLEGDIRAKHFPLQTRSKKICYAI